MLGYSAYQMQQALNLHFNQKSNYDYFTYNGKTKSSIESFNKSPLKYQYMGLERSSSKLLFHFYLLYNDTGFVYNKPSFPMFKRIRTLSSDYKLDPNGYLYPILKNDLEVLRSDLEHDKTLLLKLNQYGEPVLADYYKSERISIETLLLIDSYIGSMLNLENSPDLISWPVFVKKMNKIRPFVENLFDKDQFLQMFQSVYLNDK